MFKQLLNECTIDFIIQSEGPLLIKSGTIDESGLDMNFVKTFRNGQSEIFIPGSSLKGLFRSYSEKIVRTLSHPNQPKCCDPFNIGKDDQKQDISISCSTKYEWRKKGSRILPNRNIVKREEFKESLNSPQIYADACPICKLFGSNNQSSRFSIEDGYMLDPTQQANHRQQRDGVGIDRFTGGNSKNAKFELEVFSFVNFYSKIHIRNFEVWQIGLLAYTLYDFQQGLAKLGYGKSRGLGKFKAEIKNIEISYLSPKVNENSTPHSPELFGLKYFLEDPGYKFSENESTALAIHDIQLPRTADDIGFRCYYTFNKESLIISFLKAVVPQFNQYLDSWVWPDEMKISYFRANGVQ